MKLLIDCGNTRIKWARAAGGKLIEVGDIAHRGRDDRAVETLGNLAAADVESAHVASVLDDAFTARLVGALSRGGGLPVHRIETEAEAFGLKVAYREPGTLGVDRWLAMIAARAGSPGTVCVVSAGTAVTFDAVADDGVHLGGFIWAGPALAARALETATGKIGPTAVACELPEAIAVLGRSTAEAVGRGSLLAITAAIDRAVSIVAAADGEPSLVLTGGDAGLLAPWLERRAVVRPDLVLEGLLNVTDESV